MVYSSIIDDMAQPPKYPWQGRKGYEVELATYRNLLVASKQIYRELGPVYTGQPLTIFVSLLLIFTSNGDANVLALGRDRFRSLSGDAGSKG